MLNSMRGCVACDDPWPWPISSRSFGLDLENRVRSVASTVLDEFFIYLAQIITTIRGCVACYVVFRIWEFQFLANFWKFSALTLKKIYSSRWILSIFIAQMITSYILCLQGWYALQKVLLMPHKYVDFSNSKVRLITLPGISQNIFLPSEVTGMVPVTWTCFRIAKCFR